MSMVLYSFPALITCLVLILYFWSVIRCAFARRKFNIHAPAMTGHPEFDRRFRIQQNTLEQLILFLPSLWMFSFFVSPVWSGVPGLIFIVGRLIYAISYAHNPEWRRPGFAIGVVTSLILLVGALGGALRLILTAHA
jgi:glutathione S-transferase